MVMSNGWSEPLIEMSVPLDLGIAGGWSNPLAEMLVPIKPSEVIIEGWKQVATITATLSPLTMECSTDADCPEGYVCENGVCVKKETGLSLVPFAVGGAAALAVIIVASSRKKEQKGK
jgi:Cys-rich repeat protein